MEQKEILRVVILPLLISFVVFGTNNIIPSVKASKKSSSNFPNTISFPRTFYFWTFIQLSAIVHYSRRIVIIKAEET